MTPQTFPSRQAWRFAAIVSVSPDNLDPVVTPSDAQVGTPNTPLLKIGEVADRVGLSLRTVRYYEEVGLLEPAGRSPGGFRLYSEEAVRRLEVLKAMKPFGLTLEQIRELMELMDRVDANDAKGGAHSKAELEELRAALGRYVDRADQRIAQLNEHAQEVGRLRDRIVARLQRL